MRSLAILVISILLSSSLFAPPAKVETGSWVDQTFDSMTVDERIAQLFMIEVRPTYGANHLAQVEQTIRKHKVGGIVFFKGHAKQQVELTNKYQALSKTPLMVAIDAEWGVAMRLTDVKAFPYQLSLGGISEDALIHEMGREIGKQCKRLGVHVNFAPVIDVNNNPNNPIINYRSFGEDPMNVARKGWAYASGLQQEGVIACAKHFPGHGDTDVDSHKDLPVIKHTMERLRNVEFKPFEYLIEKGVQSIMTAHLFIPAIDPEPQTTISISEKGINGILRKEMGFQGLAFTDALNMKGVTKYHEAGELELKALIAGNDILLAPGNIPKAIDLIKKAMVSGRITEDYVWAKVKKVLTYKQMLGLDSFQAISTEHLMEDLESPRSMYIHHQLVERSLCLVRNKENLIPFAKNSKKKIVSVAIGGNAQSHFQKALQKYGNVKQLRINKHASESQFSNLLLKLKSYDIAIISLHQTSKYPSTYGITNRSSAFVKQAKQLTKVVLVDFGNPYNLGKFPEMNHLLMAYADEEEYEEKAAQALYGLIGLNGKLAVSIADYKVGEGVETAPTSQLNYVSPEEVGMSLKSLEKIRSITARAIRIKATPGAQVLVAKNGRIVFSESYGTHTYHSSAAVKNNDLFDLASITKVASTTLCLMKLVEEGELNLDDRMAKFLPELLETNKSYLTIRMVLEHKAGLKAWIPFYYETIDDPRIYDSVYSDHPTAVHNTYVGSNLYMLDSYKDYIFQEIYDSELEVKGKYKYSDLGMILMKELIERVTGLPLNTYVDQTFYKPMGLSRLTYLPLDKFGEEQIIPTAMSPDMRKGIVRGFVHDPAAAMLGGVSGHAGLFGNAESLAVIMQMLLNGGVYNGKQYLKSETIVEFTSQQSKDSRRGLGWDKPEFKRGYRNPASDYASRACFGHTGFTGTMVWVDPEYDLIYIFLSNRVFPEQENKKLIRESVRTDIMDVIYQSFLEG